LSKKKTPTRVWVVSADKHAPLHDRMALSCFKQAVEIIKPDGIIDLGDFCEGASVSNWQWKKKKRPPIEYQVVRVEAELVRANALMDELDDSYDRAGVKRKVFCQGNHDAWFDMFVEENPVLKDKYLFKNALRLAERGYEFYERGRYFRIPTSGPICYHGEHHKGMYHAKNHSLKSGANDIIYGHWHDVQVYSHGSPAGVATAYCVGCLKDLGPKANDWLNYQPTNWKHAFAVVSMLPGRTHTVDIIEIVNGRCAVWGQMIQANRRK